MNCSCAPSPSCTRTRRGSVRESDGKGLQGGTAYVQNLVTQLINGRRQIDLTGESTELTDNTQTLASMRVLTQARTTPTSRLPQALTQALPRRCSSSKQEIAPQRPKRSCKAPGPW